MMSTASTTTPAMSSSPEFHTLLKSHTESDFSLAVPAFPEYLNRLGHVKSGHAMKLIDVAAGINAKRHLGDNLLVVTAALDRTNFLAPIYPWEIIQVESRVTQVWNTSLECRVHVNAWDFQTDVTREITTSFLVMTAMTNDRQKPETKDVPGLLMDNDATRLLAENANVRKAFRSKEGKTLSIIPIQDEDVQTVVLERLMTPSKANTMNNVFGGTILAVIHEAGRLAAVSHAESENIVGVKQDRMSFVAPVFIGETVQAKALVTRTWNTSMEVQVELEAIDPATWRRRHVAHSYLTFVKLRDDGAPEAVKPWVPATSLQQERAEAANIRRELRSEEKQHMHRF